MRAHTAFSALRRTCAAAMLALPALALAAYPEKPITIIVPVKPGGVTPTMVSGCPFTWTVEPRMSARRPVRCQKPCVAIATVGGDPRRELRRRQPGA